VIRDREESDTIRATNALPKARKSLNPNCMAKQAELKGGLRCTVRDHPQIVILNGELSEWSIEHAWKAELRLGCRSLVTRKAHVQGGSRGIRSTLLQQGETA
jgi:hypothetical protein